MPPGRREWLMHSINASGRLGRPAGVMNPNLAWGTYGAQTGVGRRCVDGRAGRIRGRVRPGADHRPAKRHPFVVPGRLRSDVRRYPGRWPGIAAMPQQKHGVPVAGLPVGSVRHLGWRWGGAGNPRAIPASPGGGAPSRNGAAGGHVPSRFRPVLRQFAAWRRPRHHVPAAERSLPFTRLPERPDVVAPLMHWATKKI